MADLANLSTRYDLKKKKKKERQLQKEKDVFFTVKQSWMSAAIFMGWSVLFWVA